MKSKNLLLAAMLALGGVFAVAAVAATTYAALGGQSDQKGDGASKDAVIRAAPSAGRIKGELSGFRYVTVSDPNAEIPLMKVFLPDGWTAQAFSSWQQCSAESVAYARVLLQNDDKSASIVISTPESFIWGTLSFGARSMSPQLSNLASRSPGCDIAKRSNHLQYGGPWQYLLYALNDRLQRPAALSEVNIAPRAGAYRSRMMPYLQNSGTEMARLATTGSVTVRLAGSDASLAAYRGSVITPEGASLPSEHLVSTYGNSLASIIGQDSINTTFWYGQVISYYASTQASFDANYRIFQTVTENSRIQPQWFMLSRYLGQRIRQAVNSGILMAWEQIRQEEEQLKKEMSGRKPDAESVTTSQVTEAMSDAIYERNDYTDPDGNHFKVDTGYDVYLDSDDRYHVVESGAPVPDSFTPVKPNAIADYPK